MTVRFKRLARADLRELVAFLSEKDYDGSLYRRFLESLDKACDTLARFPRIGRLEPTQEPSPLKPRELRRLPLSRFPKYLLLYTVEDDLILIHRVIHSARNPSLRLADPS